MNKPESVSDLESAAVTLRRFATGAVRDADADAYRFDLISPIGLRRVAARWAFGAKKYGDFNWEKGMDIPSLLNHALQHQYQYLSGDRSDDHLGAAAWGLLAACHSEELWPHLNLSMRGEGCTPPAVAAPVVSEAFRAAAEAEAAPHRLFSDSLDFEATAHPDGSPRVDGPAFWENRKATILTRSGVLFDLLNPTPDMIRIEDIACGLSHMPRFAGQTSSLYTVAQHSLLVAGRCPPPDALVGLLHDAAEAYLMDLPSPLKALLPDYRRLEDRLWRAIAVRFHINADIPESVKAADREMLRSEQARFFDRLGTEPFGDSIFSPPDARYAFLNRFFSLSSRVGAA